MAHMVNAINNRSEGLHPGHHHAVSRRHPDQGMPGGREGRDAWAGRMPAIRGDAHHDCEKVLQRLEDARLTFSGEKSAFGQSEIMVVGHLCEPYGRKPSPAKVEAISAMKADCSSVTDVRRFLGACALS